MRLRRTDPGSVSPTRQEKRVTGRRVLLGLARRWDARRELQEHRELVETNCELVPRRGEERRGRVGIASQLPLGQAERDRECDEALLRTVVEVPLEPLARGVACLDDACARVAQLVQLGAQIGLQALVL